MRDQPKEHRMLVKRLAMAMDKMGEAVSLLREARDPRALGAADKLEEHMHEVARVREAATGDRP